MRCCTLKSLLLFHRLLLLLLLVFLGVFTDVARTQDFGYQQRLWVSCDTASQLALVLSHEHDEDFDFLRKPQKLDEPVHVLVAADRLDDFKDELIANDIKFGIVDEDDNDIEEDEVEHGRNKRYASSYAYKSFNYDLDFKSYPRYPEIQAYLQVITQKYPFAKYKVLGYSYEQREIMGVKFTSGPGRKPAVLIDAGIHAREWIAPTTALYAIKQLAENASNYHLFQDVDIYIVPLVNPDGYEYTFFNQSTKYWRKTRTQYNFTDCVGADANRNFDLEWMTVGATDKPCLSTYAGSRPFSESEARAIRDFILARRDRLKVYLTLHSFGQYFLHPWGFTSDLPNNEPLLRCTAQAALHELTKVRGTVYTLGSSTNVLYPASGGSDDWAFGIAQIPIVFTIELPPSSKDIESFYPPVTEIIPVGRETFEAFKVFFKYANGEVCAVPRQLLPPPSQGINNDMTFTVTP